MMRDKTLLTEQIKQKAFALGFDAFGVSRADFVGTDVSNAYDEWLQEGRHATLHYLENNKDKRYDPRLLEEGTKSIISLAMNYYPAQKQADNVPQFAYYAYGKDYHDVMKTRMRELLSYIIELIPHASGRCFVDSAPVLESYWAMQAGIGFKGKNSLLIIPQKGSYFFLGEILLSEELVYSKPYVQSLCGKCTRCIDACPTGAILPGGRIDAAKCISFQTIENKTEEIAPEVEDKLSNRVYGCDICQMVCPWNKRAVPHNTQEFLPSEEFLNLTTDKLVNLTQEQFSLLFKGSAVKRAKYKGLMRNIQALIRKKKE